MFVANRLHTTHSYSNREQWGYVQTSSNPADYASSGISPLEKRKVDVWLYGPPFVKEIHINSTNDCCEVNEDDPELSKKIKVCATSVETNDILFHIKGVFLEPYEEYRRLGAEVCAEQQKDEE